MTRQSTTNEGYQRILVAMDFSQFAEAALKQAVSLARLSRARIVLAHTLPNLRRAICETSHQARMDMLYGDGELFQRELREESDTKMRQMILDLNATDLDIQCETLLGEPYLALTHAVQVENYDLVLAGTRGLAGWDQLLVGSTSKQLIRKCPASVWVVNEGKVCTPKRILAATDFSDASRKAVQEGLWVANRVSAEFHLLHVVDSADVAEDIVTRIPHGSSLKQEITEEANRRFESFLQSLDVNRSRIYSHLSYGSPWQEIGIAAQDLNADLIAIGTVGRSGIKGLLLGNTAEKLLSTSGCSVLTVKPAGFVSPIEPPSWRLHP
jgi:nucleotide-binding universal stress UspA family protein